MPFERITYVSLCSLILLAGPSAAFSSGEGTEGCDLVSPSIYILSKMELDDNSLGNSFHVSWRNLVDFYEDDSIAVWFDGSAESMENPVEVHKVAEPNGYKLLNIKIETGFLEEITNSSLKNLPRCLRYRVGFISKKKIEYSNCLEFRPNWMQEISESIKDIRITDLILPGIDLSEQKLTPWYPLIFGARYLKLTIYYEPIKEKFLSKQNKDLCLIQYLHEVFSFLKQSNEVVVLEIRLINKDQIIIQRLKEILISLLRDQLFPKTMGPNPALKELWQANKRLILACSLLNNSNLIWNWVPNVIYKETEFYLSKSMVQSHSSLWSLRVDNSNAESFLQFFEKKLWKSMNIITIPDVIQYANIVDLIIKANKKKKHCSAHPQTFKHLVKSKWRKRKFKRISEGPQKACMNQNDLEVKVWPTIKAQPQFIRGNLTFRLIQINWEIMEVEEGDVVAIFEDDPSHFEIGNSAGQNDKLDTSNISSPFMNESYNQKLQFKKTLTPIFTAKPFATEGFITSDVSFQRPSISDLSRGGCVGPWVAFLRNNLLLATKCLMSHPSWMWDNRESLAHHPLRSLIIPGTHNSGSYLLNDDLDPVSAWVVCQDEDALSQLLYGIRYFDLRIGYYPDTDELLWINHDTIRWTPLEKVLNALKRFSYISPDPVIVDVHRTPVGFDHDEAPLLLASLINKTLGEFLAPYALGDNVTLMDMWENGKSVIVSYGSRSMRERYSWLWPPIFQAWANAQTLEDLKNFVDEKMKEEQKANFWAAMGHLTPSIWDIVFKVDTGVRGMADKTGKLVTKWLQELWSDLSNIVTVDYFHTSYVIHTSIRLNIIKHNCPEKLHVGKNRNTSTPSFSGTSF